MRKHNRVYQIAKEHNVSSDVLLGMLSTLGIEAGSSTDKVDDDGIDRVFRWFEKYPDGVAPPQDQQESEAIAEEEAKAQPTPEPPAETPAQMPTMPPVAPVAQMPVMPPVAPPASLAMPPIPNAREKKAEPGAKPAAEAPAARAMPRPPKPSRDARPAAGRGDDTRRPAKQPEAASKKPSGKQGSDRSPARDDKRKPGVARGSAPRTAGAGESTDRTQRHGRRKERGSGFALGATADLGRAGSLSAAVNPLTAGRKRKPKRRKAKTASTAEIQANVQKTLSAMDRGRVKRTYDRSAQGDDAPEEVDNTIIRVTEFVSVTELADMMDVKATEVIGSCLKLGMMVSINQRLDMEIIQIIADDYGFTVEQLAATETELVVEEEVDDPDTLKPRPPVITVMGHVDHGKTSLLDHIRETNVIAGESGGITQHIGAYIVSSKAGDITFLDTPGHEAFTAMRSRGAQVTDVVVLIIAADDSVMPQTVEAINHARAASVPMIVAINKVDLPAANPARIRQQLTQHEVIVEEFGGGVQSVEVSAMTGQGIPELLELLALETEILELKANPDKSARGTVVEAQLDRGRGPVATVLVEGGTLKVGDSFVAGMHAGRVRALLDERGNAINEATPSQPAVVLGFDSVPAAGDKFVVTDEREARQTAQHRQQLRREQEYNRIKKVNLNDLHRQITEGEIKTLPIIVKGDVDGSVGALSDEIGQLSNAEVGVEVIHRGVGAITEGDVLLASASNAIIIGFHVRIIARARELAAQEQVEIRLYNVIYEAINDIKGSLSGLLKATVTEVHSGSADVRQLFKVPRVGTVAGCYVTDGIIHRTSLMRVVRDGTEVYNGHVGTLRRVKDDVREVNSGFECGIWVEGYNDVKVGDVLEAYELKETARTFVQDDA